MLRKILLGGYFGLTGSLGLLGWPFYYRHLRRRDAEESFYPRLGLTPPPSPPPGWPRLWLHGVSVGEIASAPPLVEELRRLLPEASLTISTGTATGQEVARRLFGPLGATVCYFPLDLPWAVSRALRVLKPDVFLALESELWPGFLMLARERGCKLALLNARLSERSFRRYLRVPSLAAAFLDLFDVIAAGSAEDAARLSRLGAPRERLHLTGNLKVDRLLRAWQERQGVSPLPSPSRTEASSGEPQGPAWLAALGIKEAPVFLAASTHAGEEEMVLEAYGRLRAPSPALLLVLAPRHPERAAAVEALARGRGWPCARLSRLKAGEVRRGEPVILVDTIGDLFDLYAVATVAFVGGSLIPHGGQNLLEAAVWGLAPLSGPHLNNFRWAEEMLTAASALAIVEDAASLAAAVQARLADPQAARQAGDRARRALAAHQGAAVRQAELVASLLK
ncbi:MAG: 3-deoxy-D-manno-octulosonic acid transferase [Desulfobaccales bacterium]